jgi:diguanylate cyclase (GGDEF)-like protein
VIGQISLYSKKYDCFTATQADWMSSFSNHAAIAVANALLRDELNEQARHDSLTLALNHGAFIEELHAACRHATLHGETLALIMLDLDNFKEYNDRYGHVMGDTVLKLTTQAICQHIKKRDLVGRWGGEEFGIAMPRTDCARALIVAERIRKTLAETQLTNGHGQRIPSPTASQGLAALGETARDVHELIEQADRALYRAKNRGRDQVAVTSETP